MKYNKNLCKWINDWKCSTIYETNRTRRALKTKKELIFNFFFPGIRVLVKISKKNVELNKHFNNTNKILIYIIKINKIGKIIFPKKNFNSRFSSLLLCQ